MCVEWSTHTEFKPSSYCDKTWDIWSRLRDEYYIHLKLKTTCRKAEAAGHVCEIFIHSFVYLNQTLGPLHRNRIQKHRKTEGETEKKIHTHRTALTITFVEVDIIILNRNLKLWHTWATQSVIKLNICHRLSRRGFTVNFDALWIKAHGTTHEWCAFWIRPMASAPLQQLTILSLFIVESKASKAANKGEGQASIPSKCVILKYWI